MENDEEVIIDDTNEEETEVDVEETETEESKEGKDTETKKPVETPEQKVARLKRQLSQAEKAAGITTTDKVAEKPKNINKPKQEFLTRDEAILIAKGMDDSDLEQLQVIAKGKGISLIEAQKDSMFIAYKEKADKERIKTKAQVRGSKGSGYVETTKPVGDMNREEHIAFMKKASEGIK